MIISFSDAVNQGDKCKFTTEKYHQGLFTRTRST